MPWSSAAGWNSRGWNRAAAAAAGGFVPLAAASVTAPGAATYTATSTGALPASSVAVAAVYQKSGTISNFRDSVDPSTAWTSFGEATGGTIGLQLFKRIVPAGGFTTSTVFTATASFSGFDAGGFIVGGFADATGIPSPGTDNTASQGAGGSVSVAVAGPTVGTSYQFAAILANAVGVSGPDSGSDATWHFDRSTFAPTDGTGIRTYWRKATSTSGPNALNETEGAFSNIVAGWVEASL